MSTLPQARGHRRRHRASATNRELSPRARDAVLVAWCSFLSAGVGTAATFVCVDPARLSLDAMPLFWQSRSAIYALGFFLYWGMAALSAALTLYMARTAGRR